MKTIAVANQKGGVGKTTIALAVATALADSVRWPVLLVDLDVQANATLGLGQAVDAMRPGLADWLMLNRPLGVAVTRIRENLDLVAGSSVAEDVALSLAREGRIEAMKGALARGGNGYRYVILDCPPSLSMLTRAAIYAARYVITPIDCEGFALQGLTLLASVIREVQERGSRVRWLGVIPNKKRPVRLHDDNVQLLKQRFEQQGQGFIWDALPLTVQVPGSQQAGQTLWECEDVDDRHRAAWAGMVRRLISYE